MGAVAKIDPNTGVHVSTGKLAPAGDAHEPQWSPWSAEWPGLERRFCRHPECDVEDWRKIAAEA